MRRQRIIFVYIFLIIISGINNINAFADDTPVYFDIEKQIMQEMQNKGYASAYVSVKSSELLIRFETDVLDTELPLMMVEAASVGNSIFYEAERIAVETYHEGKALFSMNVKSADIAEFREDTIDFNELLNRLEFDDIRSREDLIKDEFLELGVHVHDISLNNNNIKAVVTYMGSDEYEMMEDYIAMGLIALQNAPWIDGITVAFSFEQGRGAVSYSSTANNILGLLEGKITEEQFFNRVRADTRIYEPYTGWRSRLNHIAAVIRGFPFGNALLLVILAVIILIVLRWIIKIRKLFRRKRVRSINKTS